MAIQTINLGTYANDGTGDDLRTAFQKVNANFAELTTTINVNTAVNLGAGEGLFYQKNVNVLEFKSLVSDDNSVVITSDNDTVNLKATPHVVEDTAPELGGNLNLNEHYVYNGDVQTTIFGIDPRTTNALLELLISSNQLNIDLGSIITPSTASVLDMNGLFVNGFAATPQTPVVDFGTFN